LTRNIISTAAPATRPGLVLYLALAGLWFDIRGEIWYTERQEAHVIEQDLLRRLSARTLAIVRWLIANEALVTEPAKVQVTFDCAGGTMSVEIKRREKVTSAHLR